MEDRERSLLSAAGTREEFKPRAPGREAAGDYIEELEELAGKLPAGARQKVLGQNVMHLYGCR